MPDLEYAGAEIRSGTKDVVNERAITASVIEPLPEPRGNAPQPSLDQSIFWFLGNFADEIGPWGRGYKLRDAQLRNFILQENIFAAALGIIASRNSGFSWKIDGPERMVTRMQDIFENSDMGRGWHDLIVKTSIDLYTQDNGAFWEIVRMGGGDERSPVLGINHLDSQRCWHTGYPEAPVIYQDRLGRYHLMRWYEVVAFAEMPVPVEGLYGLQYSALSRMLKSAQTMRNEMTLDYERTGGMNARQIHMVKGITSQQLTDSINRAKATADSQGLTRFINPIVIGTIDPTADVGHDTIDLASKPEGHDQEIAFAQYINLIAMAFSTDYQEFAPLPGSQLGTGAQSTILHQKSRGKGPGTFMKVIAHAINFRILPKSMRFIWDEQDFEADELEAKVQAIRAQTRATRIASGEITTEVARQEAADSGDLKYEYLALMGEEDVTPNVMVNDDSTAAAQATNVNGVKPGMPGPKEPPGTQHPELGTGGSGGAGATTGRPNRRPQPANIAPQRSPEPMGTKAIDELEDYMTERAKAIKATMDSLVAEIEVLKSSKN